MKHNNNKQDKFMMIMVIILLIIINILNVVDYCQTIYAVQLLGLSIEANPIARFLFEHNCEWIKLIIMPTVLIIMGIIIKIDRRFIWLAWLLLALYIMVVTNNFIVMARTELI